MVCGLVWKIINILVLFRYGLCASVTDIDQKDFDITREIYIAIV